MESITIKGIEFEHKYNNQFVSLYVNDELQFAICIANEEYIPIDNFKEVFLTATEYIEKHKIKYFLFDKQKLRTFHQPSMEWYFAIWKQTVKKKGLTNHYKILPLLDWFEKAVEAGKYEILKKYSPDILNGISVKYIGTIEEAIDDIQSKN